MKAKLVIPRPVIQLPSAPPLNSKTDYRFPLRWTDNNPASRYGAGVLLTDNNEVFDGVAFRYLRDSVGAWIDTDAPEQIASALGVQWQDDMREPGIGAPVDIPVYRYTQPITT